MRISDWSSDVCSSDLLDADATRINVTTEFDALDSMSAITVADNGSGIEFSEIAARFQRLGDSWKRTARFSKAGQRFLHGKDGQGRFKALSLGRVVQWTQDRKSVV